MTEVRRESFDRRDLFADGVGHALDAGTNRLAIQVHGARAALRHAASIFGPGQAQCVPQNPKERRARIDVDIYCLAIDLQSYHADTPSKPAQPLFLRGMVPYARPAFPLSQEINRS